MRGIHCPIREPGSRYSLDRLIVALDHLHRGKLVRGTLKYLLNLNSSNGWKRSTQVF